MARRQARFAPLLQNGIRDAILRPNMAYIPRLLPIPGESFFLLGPRGTGKTTWLRQHFPDALFVNLVRTLLLYRGSERLEVAGIRCVPVEEFLTGLQPGRGPTAGL
jgi:predicted AAA+ superfamily ATPase